MKLKVTWQGGLNFSAENEKGQSFIMGGDGEYPSPMEHVLSAVGGCSSIDVLLILQKSRQQVEACECELTAERAESDPKVFTKIHAHYVVSGSQVGESQVERACKLSLEKYCSVALMLNANVQVTHSFTIQSV